MHHQLRKFLRRQVHSRCRTCNQKQDAAAARRSTKNAAAATATARRGTTNAATDARHPFGWSLRAEGIVVAVITNRNIADVGLISLAVAGNIAAAPCGSQSVCANDGRRAPTIDANHTRPLVRFFGWRTGKDTARVLATIADARLPRLHCLPRLSRPCLSAPSRRRARFRLHRRGVVVWTKMCTAT